MSHIHKHFIGCDNSGCDALCGGPEAGEYDVREWVSKSQKDGVAALFEYLEVEALDANWIKLQYAGERAIVCSPRCAIEWLEAPRTN